MVMPAGVEPAACSLGENRSIQLSYGTTKNRTFSTFAVENK